MFSPKERLHISYRHWKGESLQQIADDFAVDVDTIIKMRKDHPDEIKGYEKGFAIAETQRLMSDDPVSKARFGIVLQAYVRVKDQAQLPQGICEASKGIHGITGEMNLKEAEDAIKDFEDYYNIKLI